MYASNHLLHRLRQSSMGREDARFASLENGESLSYGGLFDRAGQMAAALHSAGLQPGDRVAVQVEKSIESVQLYLGTVLAGGVFLPLNTAYTASEVAYFLDDAEPAVFVCTPDRSDELRTVADPAGVNTVLTLGAQGEGSLVELAEHQAKQFTPAARSEDDLAAILYTSGTTGRSKGAMLTHGNLASNATTLKSYWQFTADDVLIHALPIFHTHGLFVAINTTLMAGSSLHFMTRFDADAIIEAMRSATVLMGVPTFYVRLLEHPDLLPKNISSMRLFVSGSAPLLSDVHDAWRGKTGHAILERYGMTETNMITSNPYDGDRCGGTVGFALPGVEVRISHPNTGAVLPAGEIGAIEVRGPNVFKGYWRMPEKTAEELRTSGFFLTGDVGVFDQRGYLSIVGRSKDLIISGGYNVYPKEVESRIDAIDGVVESAVFGVPHPDVGEAVAAAVVLQSGAVMTVEEIGDAVAADLARYKQPRRYYLVDELPRNTMGKVQKKALRDRHRDAFVASA